MCLHRLAAAAALLLALCCLGPVLTACSEQTVRSANTPPGAALIYPPPEGATAFETTPVVLRGQVTDAGSATEELAFSFISDRDGELGRGFASEDGAAEIEAVTLSVGLHRITLQATDPSGASGSASADLEIASNSSPVVAVTTAEGAVFLEGEPVILEGTVGDPDHDLSSLVLTASSDTVEVGVEPVINGDGFEGEWFLALSALDLGEHAVVLEAADPLGKTGGAVATFRVAPPAPTQTATATRSAAATATTATRRSPRDAPRPATTWMTTATATWARPRPTTTGTASRSARVTATTGTRPSPRTPPRPATGWTRTATAPRRRRSWTGTPMASPPARATAPLQTPPPSPGPPRPATGWTTTATGCCRPTSWT